MTSLTRSDLEAMLKMAADSIEREHEALSELDSAIGDGDHGVTILRTMRAVVAAIDKNEEDSLSGLLNTIAMSVMMCDGGSVSPLLGSYFLGLASGAAADELTAEQTAAMFSEGLARVKTTGWTWGWWDACL